MKNVEIVKRLEASDDLDDNFPNVFFLHELLVGLTFTNPLKYVAIISIFHDDTI